MTTGGAVCFKREPASVKLSGTAGDENEAGATSAASSAVSTDEPCRMQRCGATTRRGRVAARALSRLPLPSAGELTSSRGSSILYNRDGSPTARSRLRPDAKCILNVQLKPTAKRPCVERPVTRTDMSQSLEPSPGEEGSSVADPDFTRALLADLVRGTRMSNALPSEDTRDFANASFPAFQTNVAGLGPRLTGMMQGFVDQHTAGGPTNPSLGIDDVSERFDSIVDLTDRMLERVDGDLERHNAARAHGLEQAMGGGALQMVGGLPGQSQQQQQQQQQRRPPAAAMSAPAHSSASIKKPQHRWFSEVRAPLLASTPRANPHSLA